MKRAEGFCAPSAVQVELWALELCSLVLFSVAVSVVVVAIAVVVIIQHPALHGSWPRRRSCEAQWLDFVPRSFFRALWQHSVCVYKVLGRHYERYRIENYPDNIL